MLPDFRVRILVREHPGPGDGQERHSTTAERSWSRMGTEPVAVFYVVGKPRPSVRRHC